MAIAFLSFFLPFIIAQNGLAKTPSNDDYDAQIRKEMLSISKQLGVTCVYCHSLADFRSNKIPAYNIAKEHMRVVRWINSPEGWNKKPEVSCMTCHHGQAKLDISKPTLGPQKSSHKGPSGHGDSAHQESPGNK